MTMQSRSIEIAKFDPERSEKQVQYALAWRKAIFEGTPNAVIICDSDAVIVEVNPATCALLGQPSETLLGMQLSELLPDVAHSTDYFGRLHRGEKVVAEARINAASGYTDVEYQSRLIRVVDANYIHITCKDVTARKRAEEDKRRAEAQLQYQALNDELTGLPNRRLFGDRLSQALHLAERNASLVGLLYLDLDGFKLVNDSLGHSVGDTLLHAVASRLKARVRQSDTLARMGGDEFTVILTHIHRKEDADLVANELIDILGAPFLIDGHKVTVSGSVGISVFPTDAIESSTLLQHADSAMYAAKRNGKNRYMHYTADLGSSIRERMTLESQLRGAIGRGEIAVHYQPEFEVSSNRLKRFEALARWNHPTLGTIPPSTFIPIAEESGIIITLGAYIMEQACVEAVKWQSIAPYPIQVAVNVSSIQFAKDNFVEEVVDILDRTGLNPSLLQIEVTESVMLGGIQRSAEIMKRLKAIGVSFAIDDFGTGYSCLSYLPTLPFDALKIDRSFISDLAAKPEAQALVQSLIALAHNLSMRVVVEGVEKPDQLDSIQRLGGNEVQGFLLGRPCADPVGQLIALLEREKILSSRARTTCESRSVSEAEPDSLLLPTKRIYVQ
jgi:diguanylate cyclase (GGDEF)-like protein/PAS domain S-box-containing protein